MLPDSRYFFEPARLYIAFSTRLSKMQLHFKLHQTGSNFVTHVFLAKKLLLLNLFFVLLFKGEERGGPQAGPAERAEVKKNQRSDLNCVVHVFNKV